MAKNIFWYFIWSIYLEEAWNKIVYVLKNYLVYILNYMSYLVYVWKNIFFAFKNYLV